MTVNFGLGGDEVTSQFGPRSVSGRRTAALGTSGGGILSRIDTPTAAGHDNAEAAHAVVPYEEAAADLNP
jgi:hypothetical protein